MGKPLAIICDAPCLGSSLDTNLLRDLLGETLETVSVPYACTRRGLEILGGLASRPDCSRVILLTGHCPAVETLLDSALLSKNTPFDVMDISRFKSESMAAARVLFHLKKRVKHPVKKPRRLYDDAVLVIGGGVAGVQAALDLSEGEKTVYLAERSVSIGGIMSQLDKTFPTLDCSICILGPKLADVGRDDAIKLLTLSEVKSIKGTAGRFDVTLTLHPRYVDMDKCTGCGSCTDVCPVVLPNAWDLNLKARKCIHVLFAQSIPLRATIDRAHCIECQLCVQACEKDAIRLDDPGSEKHLRVGAIIVATGLDPFDAAKRPTLGYGRFDNVFTNIDFERIVCASGPTDGELVRPDGRPIKRVAFIQCVGSRDTRLNRYCSGYCCMASIKEAMLIRESVPDAEITIFFNDIRAAGKGFEELYLRAMEHDIRFIRGFPARIEEDPETKNPILWFEEMVEGTPKTPMEVDFVVLAGGVEPDSQTETLAGTLGIARDDLGFLQERHPTWGSIETTVPGIFMAGGIQGPKDIPESVAQASGAAARALALLNRMKREAPSRSSEVTKK